MFSFLLVSYLIFFTTVNVGIFVGYSTYYRYLMNTFNRTLQDDMPLNWTTSWINPRGRYKQYKQLYCQNGNFNLELIAQAKEKRHGCFHEHHYAIYHHTTRQIQESYLKVKEYIGTLLAYFQMMPWSTFGDDFSLVSSKYQLVISQIYDNCDVMCTMDVIISNLSSATIVVKQTCTLSPTLFLLRIDDFVTDH